MNQYQSFTSHIKEKLQMGNSLTSRLHTFKQGVSYFLFHDPVCTQTYLCIIEMFKEAVLLHLNAYFPLYLFFNKIRSVTQYIGFMSCWV